MRRITAILTALGALLFAAFVTRPVRILGEVGGEALNVLTFGLLAMLVLAQPAFRETGPDWLRQLDLAVTFVDSDGRMVGHRGIRHDDSLTLADYPQHLIDAVLATEDRRFWRHYGLDPVGIARALVANGRADGVVQGGSTITQQLAKNLFLSGERTFERKLNEAFLALWLEAQLSKREILKLYLERSYLGGGAFGMQAASELYFGKSARELDLAEAATLAGLFKAPSRYAPHAFPEAAASRAREVLDNMAEAGFADRPAVEAAKRQPVATLPRRPGDIAPDYFLDWAFREVQRLAAQGAFGRQSVLTAEVTLDRALQRHAEQAVAATLDREGDRYDVDQAALIVMRPDGAVRALVGGRDYGESQFNRAADAHRQSGSAFKPFVYAAALARAGLGPDSTVVDSEICIARWCPSNYAGGFSGPMALSTALARSINTVAVRLTVEIGRVAGEMTVVRAARYGRARVADLVRDLGVASRLPDAPSLPLGVADVTLAEMTGAYAAFASGGLRAEPHAVREVRDARGQTLWQRRVVSRRVLSPRVVRDMNEMLQKVVEAGTARRAALPRMAVGGKTGTTNAYRDAWFVGFTGHLVAGAWLGNDASTPTKKMTGGSLPVQVWHDVMAFAHRDLPPMALPRPSGPFEEEGPAVAIREAEPAQAGRSVPAFREVRPEPATFREVPAGRGFAVVEPGRLRRSLSP